MHAREAAAAMADAGRMLHRLGLSPGTTGNIAVRTADGILVTPSGARMGDLSAETMSLLAPDGTLIAGPRATKESFLHLAVLRTRPDLHAVVHVHAPHITAVACLDSEDPDHPLRPHTAYIVRRLGGAPRLPYAPPGDESLRSEVERVSATHPVFLLASHGSVCASTSLADAVALTEELEAAAKAQLALGALPVRALATDQLRVVEAR
jgi:ribulose-5-phosphate 4-epimerase/fuculose-1-phosphate aldolase